MPFPLRRLPFLALIEVIRNVDVKDIINVIQMSTWMRKIVKISKIPIQLYVVGEVNIHFEKLSDRSGFNTVPLFVAPEKLKQKNLPFEPSVSIHSYDEEVKGYRGMMDDFVEFFVVESVDLNLSTITSSGICAKYLEYAMNLGLKLDRVQLVIQGDCDVDDHRKLLLACANVPQLQILSSTEDPIFDVFREYSMDRLELIIQHYHDGFKIQHLLALVNCSSVKIRYADMTDEDLNTFLKVWMTGVGKMRSLDITIAHEELEMGPINSEVVMNGIANREMQSGFEIEKSNGARAQVLCRNLRFSLRNVV
ncbi:unnamed protein product [Caenorhabditis brenneri]